MLDGVNAAPRIPAATFLRKALLISLACHVVLTVGILRWKLFTNVQDESRNVYEVSLVDAVHSANSATAANVQPAVFSPQGQQQANPANVPMPAPPLPQIRPMTENDLAATPKDPNPEPKREVVDAPQTGRARTPSPVKGSRFAIDAPAGEAINDPIGDIEARGSVSQPLHVTHPGPYSESYVILREVRPTYPQHEKERNIEGSVTVEVLVDTMGNVAHADVLEVVGPDSFGKAALEAVRQFEFQPPVENGEASTMWIKFDIKFRING
jgi:protein TonB